MAFLFNLPHPSGNGAWPREKFQVVCMNNHGLVESGWLVVLSQVWLEDTVLQVLLSVFEAINSVGLPFMSGGEHLPPNA